MVRSYIANLLPSRRLTNGEFHPRISHCWSLIHLQAAPIYSGTVTVPKTRSLFFRRHNCCRERRRSRFLYLHLRIINSGSSSVWFVILSSWKIESLSNRISIHSLHWRVSSEVRALSRLQQIIRHIIGFVCVHSARRLALLLSIVFANCFLFNAISF